MEVKKKRGRIGLFFFKIVQFFFLNVLFYVFIYSLQIRYNYFIFYVSYIKLEFVFNVKYYIKEQEEEDNRMEEGIGIIQFGYVLSEDKIVFKYLKEYFRKRRMV